MAATWEEASELVVKMADDCIREHRPYLVNANIGFLFRSEPSSSKGRTIIGKAQKVTARLKPFLDLDFIIWISKPDWLRFDVEEKRALLHHELCHCEMDPDTDELSLRAHDIEEFNEVIRAHGLWFKDLIETAKAIQPHLPGLDKIQVEHKGEVVAIDPGQLAQGTLETISAG